MVVVTYKFVFFLDLYFLKHGVLGENRNLEEACPNFPINFYEFWFPLLISILVAQVVLIHISNVHLFHEQLIEYDFKGYVYATFVNNKPTLIA